MNFKRPVLILIPIVLAGLIVAGYLLGTPRLLEVTPADGSAHVPGGAPLRLTFSRPMDPVSVQSHLSLNPKIEGDYSWEGNTLIFRPKQAWKGGQTVEGQLSAGAKAAGWLPLPIQANTRWSFTIGQPRLVYLFPANAPANLYVLNPANGEKIQLTDTNGGIADFTLASGGRACYYSVKNASGGYDIYRMDGLSSDLTDIAFTPLITCGVDDCGNVAVSPRGDWIAYERTQSSSSSQPNSTRVWIARLPSIAPQSAGKPPASTPTPATPALESRLAGDPQHSTGQPAWSSAGRLAYYDVTFKAFIFLDPQSGQTIKFNNETGQTGDWLPDGTAYLAPEIFFSNPGNPELDQVASSHLIRFVLKDSQTQDLTGAENLEDTNPVFSPDGRRLAFARKYLDVDRWTPGRQIWVMDVNGQGARPLTNDAFYSHYAFAWNPASDELAFVRFNQDSPTEPPEVWEVSLTTTQARQLVVGGYAPQWIP